MVDEGSGWGGGGGLRRCAMLSCFKDSPTVVRVYVRVYWSWSKVESAKSKLLNFMQEKNLLAKINNTTFNVDHSRWGRARDAHNSRIMDLRNNNNKDRMVFGSL